MAAAPPPLPPALHPDLRVLDDFVERWFSALTTKKLQRSARRSIKELAADIEAWAATWNENPTPFVWHKTADDILARLAASCTDIDQQAHP